MLRGFTKTIHQSYTLTITRRNWSTSESFEWRPGFNPSRSLSSSVVSVPFQVRITCKEQAMKKASSNWEREREKSIKKNKVLLNYNFIRLRVCEGKRTRTLRRNSFFSALTTESQLLKENESLLWTMGGKKTNGRKAGSRRLTFAAGSRKLKQAMKRRKDLNPV